MRCIEPDCGRPVKARGLCDMHYKRWRDHGSTAYRPRTNVGRWPSNVWRRMKFTIGDGCWEWFGTLTGDGYGKTWMNGQRRNAHAWVYEQLVGPIPTGLELDHLCKNKKCVRPDHLEPVTHQENMRRAYV